MEQITLFPAQVSDTISDNVIWITNHSLEKSDTQNQSTGVAQILNVLVVQKYSDVYIIKWTKPLLPSLLKSNSLPVVWESSNK